MQEAGEDGFRKGAKKPDSGRRESLAVGNAQDGLTLASSQVPKLDRAVGQAGYKRTIGGEKNNVAGGGYFRKRTGEVRFRIPEAKHFTVSRVGDQAGSLLHGDGIDPIRRFRRCSRLWKVRQSHK